MKIYLIRHGSTLQNETRLVVGDADQSSLTSLGIKELKLLKKRLPKPSQMDKIIISDDVSTKQSGKILFPNRSLVVKSFLNEINKGFLFLSKTRNNDLKMTVDEWERKYNNNRDAKIRLKFKYPSGLSIEKFCGHVFNVFGGMLKGKIKGNLFIVSHNGPIKAIICRLLGDLTLYYKLSILNGCYSEFEYSEKYRKLLKLNA
ncbi:MAG: histidine phosphatase family protein [Patescibacteria group bacterium]